MSPAARIEAVVDTSVLISREQGRPLREVPGLASRFSAITIGELRAGVLAAASTASLSQRLDTLRTAEDVECIPVDAMVAAAWAELRQRLLETGRRMPVNDSWIAATAIAHGLPVVTQDDDYDDVPGLSVIKV